MLFTEIKTKIAKLQAKREMLLSNLATDKSTLRRTQRRLEQSKEARLILQRAAVETQEKLEYHISNLVTLAESSVFPDPNEFMAEFVQRRNSSECDFYFKRRGKQYGILGSTGGGPVDVASFALRVSYLSMQAGTRPIILLDEPFKNINDPTRVLHQKIADMVKEVSRLTGFQIIMVSQIPELADIADKVFVVSKTGEISKVEEI